MINLFKSSKALLTVLTFGSIATTATAAQALTLKVEVENIGPDGGVSITPVWVGFHDGSFDSYNPGEPAEFGLELLAEDGNTDQITEDFNNNLTYINSSNESETVLSSQMGQRVDGTLGGGPITPGNKVSGVFEVVDTNDSNRYFSYASMILPTNDYFIANGNPIARDLLPLLSRDVSSISFNVGLAGTVNDAGTEINDFNFSAGNPLYPGLGSGQTAPQQGNPENGDVGSVTDPFANFLNRPADFDSDFASLNFNNETLYPNGVARVTISKVPESSTTVGLMAVGGLFLLGTAVRRRNNNIN